MLMPTKRTWLMFWVTVTFPLWLPTVLYFSATAAGYQEPTRQQQVEQFRAKQTEFYKD